MSHDSQTTAALQNLAQINDGHDPRDDTEQPPLARSQALTDEIFETMVVAPGVERSDVSIYVADWKRKLGNIKYETYIEPDTYGERVTGQQSRSGHHSIGVSTRTFDGTGKWRDTIRHELAHLAVHQRYEEAQSHGPRWRQEARRLGADPERTGSVEADPEYDYHVACPNGCFTKGRHQRSRLVQEPYRYRCDGCGEHPVSWASGQERPTEPGTTTVDTSDL